MTNTTVRSVRQLLPAIPRDHFHACAASLILAFASSASAGVAPNAGELAEFDIEQLMRVKVTSVSKRPEDLSGAPAAIYVLTPDELRRSGATSVAEAMRGVPGMDVGRISSHKWAVSSRGFNNELASKLLVLADGRSVYTPLFSGVYWDTFDTMMEDVERIEIIRGPGATQWGANAVNGVINLTSKNAKDTQGLLVTGGGGSEELGFGGVRYGSKLADNAHGRVYAKYLNRDEAALANGHGAEDDWWMTRGGFRVDWEATSEALLTFQGDAYSGSEKQLRTIPSTLPPFTNSVHAEDQVSGGNLLGRWTRTFSEDSELRLQTYYDHTERESALPMEARDTFDLDFQHRFSPMARNVVVWGAGYRLTSDDVRNGLAVSFKPAARASDLFSAFAQDEIELVQERLHFTLGSKFEHNDYTGFEYQPGVRLAWTPSQSHTIWGSISRAVRTPSRAEDDVRINLSTPVPSPVVASIIGDRHGRSEELLAYELGYRTVLHPRVSVDVTVFYNQYDHLRSLEPAAPPSSPPTAVAAFASANSLEGDTHGVELALRTSLTRWWHWLGSYTYLQQHLHRASGLDTTTAGVLEGSAPRNAFSLRSQMDLPGRWELDYGVRYVGSLHNPSIAAYLGFDARIGWKVTDRLEFALVGQNLLDDRHPEFAPSIISSPQTEVERSVYGKITWQF